MTSNPNTITVTGDDFFSAFKRLHQEGRKWESVTAGKSGGEWIIKLVPLKEQQTTMELKITDGTEEGKAS